MNSTLVGILSVLACIYFCIGYRQLDGKHIGFPVYIYFAMFPHKLRAFSIFSADDLILKAILILDLLLFVLKNRKVRINIHEISILLAICAVDTAAFIGAREVDQSLLITGFVNILFMFVFSFSFRNHVRTEEGINTALRIILHNGAILSVGAIIEAVFYGVERAELGMSNPNYLGYYLAIAFCIFYHHTHRFRLKDFCYSALTIAGILCTGSYSILFCIPAYILINFMYSATLVGNKPLLSRTIVSSLILLAVGVIWMSTSERMIAIPIVQRILDDKDVSRLYIWSEALEDFLNHPVFGVGYNTWRSRYGIGYVTHNDALRLVAETGLVGVSAFLAYWFFLSKTIAKSKTENQPFYISIMLTIVMFSCFHNNMNSLMFWVILSLPLYDPIIFTKPKRFGDRWNAEDTR